MTFSLVFDLWYPGNAAMTSSGDPSSVGYHPLPSACNTNPRACLPAPVRFTTTVNPLLQISLAIPPSKRALTPLALYRVCSNNERKRKKERVLFAAIWVPWVPSSFQPFRFRARGGREKKRYGFFFRAKERKTFRSSLPYRRGGVSIGRVFVKGIRNNIRYRLFSF